MSEYRNGATFIGLVRDHGEGQVTLDAAGLAQPWYSLTDSSTCATPTAPSTRRCASTWPRAHARISAGAGCRVEWATTWTPIARLKRVPLRAGGFKLFAAHQMGTSPDGQRPAGERGRPYGELHDTPGVWIGDASAFPTPSGTNPMITIMALAQRTGEAIRRRALPPPPRPRPQGD